LKGTKSLTTPAGWGKKTDQQHIREGRNTVIQRGSSDCRKIDMPKDLGKNEMERKTLKTQTRGEMLKSIHTKTVVLRNNKSGKGAPLKKSANTPFTKTDKITYDCFDGEEMAQYQNATGATVQKGKKRNNQKRIKSFCGSTEEA